MAEVAQLSYASPVHCPQPLLPGGLCKGCLAFWLVWSTLAGQAVFTCWLASRLLPSPWWALWFGTHHWFYDAICQIWLKVASGLKKLLRRRDWQTAQQMNRQMDSKCDCLSLPFLQSQSENNMKWHKWFLFAPLEILIWTTMKTSLYFYATFLQTEK